MGNLLRVFTTKAFIHLNQSNENLFRKDNFVDSCPPSPNPPSSSDQLSEGSFFSALHFIQKREKRLKHLKIKSRQTDSPGRKGIGKGKVYSHHMQNGQLLVSIGRGRIVNGSNRRG